MRYESDRKPRRCPKCNSKRVLNIVYGLPTYDAFLEAQAGKFALGGCCLSDDNPIWECFDCKASIFMSAMDEKFIMRANMTIYQQIQDLLKTKRGDIVSSSEVKKGLLRKFGTNKSSVMLYDYCYNRINDGTPFNKHIFQYLEPGTYRYLGENYPFTGLIYHKPITQDKEIVVGEWNNGVKTIY